MNRRNLIIMVVTCSILPFIMAGVCDPRLGVVTCPQAKTYSDEFLTAAGNELDRIAPQAPHIVTMMNDYDVTLSAIRYCIAQAKKAKKK